MIEFDGVSHAYDERVVLRDVSVTIPERRAAVIGANGSGKSTLARMVNGLVSPSRGSVRVNGLDVAKDGGKVRRRVGFVFSDPDSQIVMPTVAEDVAFSLRKEKLSRADRDARVQHTLAAFGLADHRDHPCHQLSGGQKQLLALAAVMVMQPDVLVLDEPTTLLDRCHARSFMRRLADVDAQVLLITHHLEVLGDFDRVLVIDQQRLVRDGSAEDSVQFYCDLMDARC